MSKRIVVSFEDEFDILESSAYVGSFEQDLESNISLLKENAELSQKDFIGEINGYQALNGTPAKSNWLANCIIMDATDEQIEFIKQRDDVKFVEENKLIELVEPVETNKPSEGTPRWKDNDKATWGLQACRALDAQREFDVYGIGVKVGVLDTGIDQVHPDLRGKVIDFKDCVQNKRDSYDDNGHGTHCAGTIGGSVNDGSMEIGVAPGVELVAGKILSAQGMGYVEWILDGMQWIATTGVRLVSNSWGAGPGSRIFEDAIKGWLALDILPVFAAGNAGPRPRSVGTPGGLLDAFAVGATTSEDDIAEFSSRGPVTWDGKDFVKPDVSAPGHKVTSCLPGGGYWTISGTSMATPHVAGLAALLYEKNEDLTVEEVVNIIEASAVKFGDSEKDNDFGYGRIDCLAALGLV